MLQTPLGPIIVTVNASSVSYTAQALPKAMRHCPDVDGRFQISILDVPRDAIVCCLIDDAPIHFSESGEHFEGISFYKDTVKLSIGTQADFPETPGQLLANGIELRGPATFGICWIAPVTEANDVQTYFGADLSI